VTTPEFNFNMRTNLLLLGFLLVFGTIEAHPSQGQRFARQAEEEDSTEKMMMVDEVVNNEVENAEIQLNSIIDNADDIVNNEVENPELVKEVEYDTDVDTEVEVKIKTNEMEEGEMMKDEMKPEVEDENEVEVPAVKVSVSTEATPTVAPLGVTLRAAPVTTRTVVVTTRRPAPPVVYTPAPAPAPTQAPSDPGLLGRLGNFLNSGIGNIGSSIGGNLISGGSLLAAAASPIWAPLLVGKKRRKRSGEDVKLNEIDQARSLQYITKLMMSHIKQAKNKY